MNIRKLSLVEPGCITRCEGNGAHTFVAVVVELGGGSYRSQPPPDGTPCLCGAWTWAEATATDRSVSEWLKWSRRNGVLDEATQ